MRSIRQRLDPTYWRAPRWMPRPIRRVFRGRWTKAEVEAIHARAQARLDAIRPFVN